MEGYGWILSIILGAIAGWIAEKIMKGDHGLLANIILGILGALIGNWLFRAILGTTAGGLIGQLIVAVIGACILIAIYRMIRGKSVRH
ncbi:GlsB/YeaQ/YmgE family stress response membrane protein [Paracoccus sp. T5]|uniref:GlsB/YeaQ/YmgE family stress response membrane protein n=1 Tax=Paracoccus sp. T5 TaxID=3402161 RepID=UPI003AE5DB48